MLRILITGANSFIGSSFRRFSAFSDTEEVSLIENKPAEISFSKYDVVLHVAAIVHQSGKISDDEYFRVNRDLCLDVAREAKKAGIKQFVFLSTVKVYGNHIKEGTLLKEDSPCFPDDSYGRSKHEAEKELALLEDENFTISVIRTPLVYGPGVKANMLNLIKIVERFRILPFGNMHNKRSFTYIENLVGFIDRIIERKASGIFIPADRNAVSTTDLILSVSNHLGKKVMLFKIPRVFIFAASVFLPGYTDRLFGSLQVDNTLTKLKLDYDPPYSTDEGIKRMVNAYRKK